MKLQEYRIGRIDAKEEVIDDYAEGTEFFPSIYMLPTVAHQKKFDNKNYFIISGLKGVGKTALLRYLDDKLKAQESITHFILFKSNIAEAEREKLQKSSNFEIVQEVSGEHTFKQDFEDVWMWFLMQTIYDIFVSNEDLFESGADPKEFKELMSAFSPRSAIQKRSIFPKISNQRIEVIGDGGPIKTKYSADLSFDQNSSVPLYELSSAAFELIKQINNPNRSIYIFMDELDVFYGHRDQYDRDCRLVRDLIVVARKINREFAQEGVSIHVVVSVRSEVLRAPTMNMKEVDRIIRDFGVEIAWHFSGKDREHPLLKVLEHRVNQSRVLAGAEPFKDVWSEFFPHEVEMPNGRRFDIKEYILHRTWYRPRDLVQMLISLRTSYPQESVITQDMMLDIRSNFSDAVWTETKQELAAAFSEQQISGVKNIFNGWKSHFTFEEFRSRLTSRAAENRNVKMLYQEFGAEDLLLHLFRIGIVGNEYKISSGIKNIWSFRGEEDLLFDKQMVVHRAIRPALSIMS